MNHKAYIHPEGWKFALIFFAISITLTYIFLPLALLGYLLTFFTLWFFRNPERNIEKDINSIISSADGKVCLIDEASPPPELEMGQEKMLRVCVFMNVFNVHVNRTPISGEIKKNSLKNVKIGINPVSLIKEHKQFHWKNVQLAESKLLFYMKGLFDWSNSLIL